MRGAPCGAPQATSGQARVMPSAKHRPRCHGSRVVLPVEVGGDALGVQAVERQVQLTAGGGKCGRASPRLCERLGGPRHLRGAGGDRLREGSWRGPRLLASAAGACEQAHEAGGTCTCGNPAGNHPAATGSRRVAVHRHVAGLAAGGSGVPREPHQEVPGDSSQLHAPRRCPGESTQLSPPGWRRAIDHVEFMWSLAIGGVVPAETRAVTGAGQPPGWAAYTSSSHSRP